MGRQRSSDFRPLFGLILEAHPIGQVVVRTYGELPGKVRLVCLQVGRSRRFREGCCWKVQMMEIRDGSSVIVHHSATRSVIICSIRGQICLSSEGSGSLPDWLLITAISQRASTNGSGYSTLIKQRQ